MDKIRVTIWNEFYHERFHEEAKLVYPEGIHEHLRKVLACDDFEFKTAWLDKDEHDGLDEDVLNNTDVLIWWGHMKHKYVKDEVVDRVCKRVNEGMGLIVLHSGHHSKVFKKLMGTTCNLMWREIGEHARVWCVDPSHPIAQGIPMSFVLEKEEMYGERFQVPTPDELIFVTWWQGGEIFRGGVTYKRGNGKIFYFHGGHETVPTYYNSNVIQIIKNAIYWAKPNEFIKETCDWKEPDEIIPGYITRAEKKRLEEEKKAEEAKKAETK